MKPEACKIWPFKVTAEPKYGEPDLAAYDFNGREIYIYVDKMCNGIKYGKPTWEFQNQILPEFVELAVHARELQHHTTGRVGFEWLK